MIRPPAGVRVIRERAAAADIPLHVHPDWAESFDWLAQGTTGTGEDPPAFDLGLFGDVPVGTALERWRRLRQAMGFSRAIHARQVHGDRIQRHGPGSRGLTVLEDTDGHWTDQPDVLLTVSVADCVPISVVDPERRRVALLHGGWRGTAAGILVRGIRSLGGDPARLLVHLGPAICGRCYEVGPEVHEALGLEPPPAPEPVDVRAVQARQAVTAGVPSERITTSEHCTRCGPGFFSHRAGATGRQVGLLGIRS